MSKASLEIGPVGHHVLENVRRLRRRQGLSAQQLADRIAFFGGKIGRPAIFKIEAGERRVAVDDLSELAKALGVTPVELMAAASECGTCQGMPPVGFLCRACGTDGVLAERAPEGTTR